MLKKILYMIKLFKGVKHLVLLKCDNCNSINVSFDKKTLKEDYIEKDGRKYKTINYHVRCENCYSAGQVAEIWGLDN